MYQRYLPYFKQIIILSLPIIVGQLGIVLMGVADVIMIGKLKPIHLAAASLANAIYFFIAILGIGTLTAVSPLVAKSKGANEPKQCAGIYKQSIHAAFILSIFIGIILYIITENLHWFKQDPAVSLLAKDYLHLLNIGTLPMLLFFAIKQYSDGLGITKPSAIITIIALLINVFLNWVFIYGNLGSPKLELLGAGIATSSARAIMAISMYIYIRSNTIYKPYLKTSENIDNTLYLKQIFSVGIPSGLQYFFEVGAFAFAAIMIGWINEFALAAHQVAINIASITYMIATGISAGGSIAVGEALGEKNKKNIIDFGRAALLMGTLFMTCCAIILAAFAPNIISLYTTDAKVASMATSLLYIAAFFQISDGIQCVGLGVLRGIGDTKIPTVITIFAYWIIGIPLGYILCFKFSFNLYGVWLALLIGLSLSAWLLSKRFLRESNKIHVDLVNPLTN
jgi:MATE family multidrug resistance protein